MTDNPQSPIGTLMMVDDNKVDQMVYKRIVERSGLVGELAQFLNAEDALDHLTGDDAVSPDLILLDINMPGMNGFEFLNAASGTLGDALSPVVIMLTTSLNPEDRSKASEYPAVKEFLTKPLTGELLQQIAASFRDKDWLFSKQ